MGTPLDAAQAHDAHTRVPSRRHPRWSNRPPDFLIKIVMAYPGHHINAMTLLLRNGDESWHSKV